MLLAARPSLELLLLLLLLVLGLLGLGLVVLGLLVPSHGVSSRPAWCR